MHQVVIAFIVALALACTARRARRIPTTWRRRSTNLATIFTDLFGPTGLIVDSLATLPGEQPHSAHFNSDFQFNFSQFGTALVEPARQRAAAVARRRLHIPVRSGLGVFQRTTQSFGPILADRADTHRRPARVGRIRVPALHVRLGRGARPPAACRQCSRTTTRNFSADGRTWSRPSTPSTADVNQTTDVRHAWRHRSIRPVPGGAVRQQQLQVVSAAHHPAPRHDQSADPFLPPVGRRGRRSSGSSPRSASATGLGESWCG